MTAKDIRLELITLENSDMMPREDKAHNIEFFIQLLKCLGMENAAWYDHPNSGQTNYTILSYAEELLREVINE